ncbi:alpha/beta fold hydrolase [Candidatus Skiveiella danica]|jgi:4,5:9,10-diseco-3-hydroxy-5,9,17-trioxoandrosta-1(10),2-diene-4-oate hydrolase|uniref:alpha/beta fold hydrolase n=1 Tax=Candidatus Skiveiella danica TaxID=3386177 RepID=UPI0009C465A1|nr:MAG: 4,5:9,10-diseco-3-hydroxy-5,9,17-trioxoandrosta-1(10),2-diene-4-oate hydrolase [Alphaproteobacteria bacterium ADurb.Bin100]
MSITPASPTARTVALGNRQIHLHEFGAGPPVLMLHGGGPGASGLSNYARNIDALASRFRVLVPDLPGYGGSSKGVNSEDPFGDLAAAMLALLDALGIDRAHVVGNSLGGACALRMALEQPGCVDRLVLMGPGGIGISQAAPTEGLKRLLGYYAGEGPTLEKLRTFICEDLVFDGSRIPEAVLRERFEASIDPEVLASPPLRAPKDLEAFRRLDFLLDPRLPALAHRTLVLWGTADRVNPATGAMALQARMPACDAYLFSRTGHWVQWERADEFNAVVTAFLSVTA